MQIDLKVRVSNISLSDGSVLHFGPDDALLIVGPNNSGKSQLLRDIESLSARHMGGSYKGKVVNSISFTAPLNHDIYEYLQNFRRYNDDHYYINGLIIHQHSIYSAFAAGSTDTYFGAASGIFVKRVSSDDRLSIVSPSPALPEAGPQTPGQMMYDDEGLISKVSDLFSKAFRKQLFLDYRSGSNIPIYVGTKPDIPLGADRISNSYVNLVRSQDKLHEQGDGMKSFAGIIMSTMVVKYNVTLIDEPEAFLHPPQERIIGRIISEESNGQVFCSTHSSNVVQGFLESGNKNIRVVRITRDNEINHVKEISASEISQLWRDPVFRYSTALDALFHDRAVLCEAESDCKFYEALSEHVKGENYIDSHFIPCAGKASFPKFSIALRKLGVPVTAILDLDVLNDEGNIKRIYEAQGGNWADISHHWRRLDAAVRKGIQPDSLDSTKSKIADILNNWNSGQAPTSQISEILNLRKPWGFIKENGISAFPAGDAYNTAKLLLDELARFFYFSNTRWHP
nr:AAA family ATPase [Sphingomonas melonis]